MHPMKALALPLLLVATALAGCSGGSSCGDFCVNPPADGGKTYSFTAGVTADNYTWDFGDNLPFGYGHDVTHTYDVASAKLTVKLYATTGTETRKYEKKDAVEFGSGANAPATFLLEGQTKWAVTGQPVRFSASASHDPDGDALRYSWACVRTGDAIPKSPHTHGNLPPPFVSPPAGSVTAGLTNRTLPAADKVIDPATDFCDALGALGHMPMSTSAATIEGTFAKSGTYKVFLLAADPAHPSVSGEYEFVVTDPGARAPPHMTWYFNGTFLVGAGQPGDVSFQQVCDLPGEGTQTCDVWVKPFEMPIGALQSWVNMTVDASQAGADVNQVTWEWQTASGTLLYTGGAGSVTEDNLHTQLPGSYQFVVKAKQGAQYGFHATVQSKMDLDPYKIYF